MVTARAGCPLGFDLPRALCRILLNIGRPGWFLRDPIHMLLTKFANAKKLKTSAKF